MIYLYYKGDVNMIGVREEVWSKDKGEESDRLSLGMTNSRQETVKKQSRTYSPHYLHSLQES